MKSWAGRLATALTATLALAACDGQPVAADGYRFGQAEFVRNDLKVAIVTHRNLADLAAAHREASDHHHAIPQGRVVMAFSVLHGDGNCTMHIIDPAADYQPIWIGHEFTHCIRGRWHD